FLIAQHFLCQLIETQGFGRRVEHRETFRVMLQQLTDQRGETLTVVMLNSQDVLLPRIQSTHNTFTQQRRTFLNRGERCFQFVRHVTEKIAALLFEQLQTFAQPVETLTQLHEVSWSRDLHWRTNAPVTQAVDGTIYLSERTRDECGEDTCHHQSRDGED